MRTVWHVGLLGLAALAGCTGESVRLALDAQRRADDVQQAVFERQHDALCVLLYRDLAARLDAAGEPLNGEQLAALNKVWNDRDLVEFWALQHERARALRIVVVDARLASSQSMVDLLLKQLRAKVERVEQAGAGAAGAELSGSLAKGGSR